ncbi:MAG: hypothetical protein QXN93_00860 [Methanomassiliicoccales archaeon]
MNEEHDSKLKSISESVAENYGVKLIHAEFSPFKELKAKWKRNGTAIELCISDYLQWADEEVLTEFIHAVMRRIIYGRDSNLYGDALKKWITTEEFAKRNRPIYLSRSKNLKLSPSGSVYNLEDIRDQLISKGLIQDSSNAFITWTINGNRSRVGYCSLIMKVIAISSTLDSHAIPVTVPSYVLYHELLHLELGKHNLTSGHDNEFRMLERKFPNWIEAKELLKKLSKRNSGQAERSFRKDFRRVRDDES